VLASKAARPMARLFAPVVLALRGRLASSFGNLRLYSYYCESFCSYTKYTAEMERKAYASDVTDEEWKCLEPLVPKARTNPYKIPRREIFNAILYVIRTGCQWDSLPHDFPNPKTVYYHYSKWNKTDIWGKILNEMNKKTRLRLGLPETPDELILDSRTAKSAAGVSDDVGSDAGKKNKGSKMSDYD